MNQNNRFYGYKHWTLEEIPRCFYVGKGTKERPNGGRRNHKWYAIVKRLGLRVEVCIGPISEEKAFQWETFNIVEEDTYTKNHHHNDDMDIGCNFTYGGEGTSGYSFKRSPETRKKMSIAQKIVQNRPEIKERKSKLHKGQTYTSTQLENMSIAQKKRYKNPEKRQKHIDGQRHRWEKQYERDKMSFSIKKRFEDPREREKTSLSVRKALQNCNLTRSPAVKTRMSGAQKIRAQKHPEIYKLVGKKLQKISDDCLCEIIKLRFVKKLTLRKIAEIFNCSRTAVECVLGRNNVPTTKLSKLTSDVIESFYDHQTTVHRQA